MVGYPFRVITRYRNLMKNIVRIATLVALSIQSVLRQGLRVT